MKFCDMKYERPDIEAVKTKYTQLTEELKNAANYGEAKAAFLAFEETEGHVTTAGTLASIRHSIDTRDAFYDAEESFWNATWPELTEFSQNFTLTLLSSPFRADFEAEYGALLFTNAEIALKTFSPEIIADMQQENDLVQAYEKLIASAQIPFEGGMYTLAQMMPFKTDADDTRRHNAWCATGAWYKEHQAELDDLYDKLVHLRDTMGKKLGYKGYTELGYYRMGRNCYTKEDIEAFRAAVIKYLVPVADSIKQEQAQRLGTAYPLDFADNALSFRSGNPRPCQGVEGIVAHASVLYRELSPETDAFFQTMVNNDLLDLPAKEGKAAGGYCTDIHDYHVPFIFANFNGTSGDVETVTHEAGHAFACYMNRDRIPAAYVWPSMEACEVHSMSMEFFAWPWAQGFYGKDTEKFYYSHLSGALTFIPYGTMVDHFQHIVYEKPDMTPRQRHDTWRQLLGMYMPWVKLDGEIPFYSDGEAWQQQTHIYASPFYYIDYCLAQTVALDFWAMIRRDPKAAWEKYMAYTVQGGSRTFVDLLKEAGLRTPFDEACLRGVCEEARSYLADFDTSALN